MLLDLKYISFFSEKRRVLLNLCCRFAVGFVARCLISLLKKGFTSGVVKYIYIYVKY